MRQVRVNRKAAGRLASGHLWVFSSDVVDTGGAEPGAPVQVADTSGRVLGTAHFSSTSQIALRLLSRRIETIDTAFFQGRLAAARDYRRRVVSDTDVYRLVHAEGDLLPALVIDRYGEYLVVQTLNQGMDQARHQIVSALLDLFSPRGIVARNDVAVRSKEQLPQETGIWHGEIPDVVTVRMNGLTWNADLLRGQKTGIFLDQRENYLAAARYGGGHALDCFTSTGGFALHLAAVCESVEAVDSSAAVLALAEANREVNNIANVRFRQADVFDMLAAYGSARHRFSMVVLDPPAFAKSRQSIEAALRGYKQINLRALHLLDRGGVLVTCSCSHHVSEAMLLEVMAQAALDAGRELRVIERRSQSRDHPILLTVPETHYLKCLILQAL